MKSALVGFFMDDDVDEFFLYALFYTLMQQKLKHVRCLHPSHAIELSVASSIAGHTSGKNMSLPIIDYGRTKGYF